jgi:hypothetical protein
MYTLPHNCFSTISLVNSTKRDFVRSILLEMLSGPYSEATEIPIDKWVAKAQQAWVGEGIIELGDVQKALIYEYDDFCEDVGVKFEGLTDTLRILKE